MKRVGIFRKCLDFFCLHTVEARIRPRLNEDDTN